MLDNNESARLQIIVVGFAESPVEKKIIVEFCGILKESGGVPEGEFREYTLIYDVFINFGNDFQ